MSFIYKLLPSVINPHYWKKTGDDLLLSWRLLGDGRVPLLLKVIPVLVVIYLLSPIDLIPGFLPVIGQLDDFGLLLVALAAFIRLAPDHVVDEYRPAALGAD